MTEDVRKAVESGVTLPVMHPAAILSTKDPGRMTMPGSVC